MAQYIFEPNGAVAIDSCTLSNGNMAVAWANGITNYCWTAVYNSSGVQIGSDTRLSGVNQVQHIACAALTGGNYVVAYRSSTQGLMHAILNTSAVEVLPATLVESTVPPTTDVVALSNGGYMVLYAVSGNGRLATYDSAGTEVTAPTDFEVGADAGVHIRGALLANNNVMIIFEDTTGLAGTLVVVNTAGSVVGGTKTVFTTNSVMLYANPILLDNGNVMIVYSDSSASFKGTFVIHAADGTQVVSPTFFKDGLINDKFDAAKLSSSNQILIAYSDISNDGYYVVLDEDGDAVTTETLFESGQAHHISVSTFGDSNDAILFLQTLTGDGTIDIQNYSGTAFSPPADIVTFKRLVAFSNNTLYYEDI
jgi:hypothetical protein